MDWITFSIGILVGMVIQTCLIKWVNNSKLSVVHKHVVDKVKKEPESFGYDEGTEAQ